MFYSKISFSILHYASLTIVAKGSKLLTGGDTIQIWICPDQPARDPSADDGVEFFIDEGDTEQPEWKLAWHCRPATPIHKLKFSPDGLLFASVGKVSQKKAGSPIFFCVARMQFSITSAMEV